jgi:SAM-dependent methyltransferase
MIDFLPLSAMSNVSVRLRRGFHGLRTEGAGAGRETAAVALGVFVGCLPVYGFHLLICWVVGSLLRLNRLKIYLAANISNPLVAPWLLFAEVEAGAYLRRGSFHALTPHTLQTTALSTFGIDLLVGSLLVGAVLAALAAGGTYAALRGSGADAGFADLVRRASDRYVGASITAWEFARNKLRYDPVYRVLLSPGVIGSGGTLLDIGCGQGLALALLAETRVAVEAGAWPADWPPAPHFARMVGIESRRRAASLARRAVGRDCQIIEGDARQTPTAAVRTVLLFDVLQMMRAEEQVALLATAVAALEPGGVILVREADASAGWRFTAVRWGNRFKALAFGDWRRSFHFRSEAGWRACFAGLGLRADVQNAGEGLPFANLLFRLTVDPAAESQRT